MSEEIDATLIVPESTRRAIEFRFPESAYRFLLLERAFADSAEGTLGNYVLLGPAPGENGAWTFYVGKVGTGTVAQRIANHLKDKSWWNRVLVVLPHIGNDSFTSASAGFLEGEIYRRLSDFRFAVSQNNNTPGDNTPSEWEKARLRRGVLLNLVAVLRVLGYDTTSSHKTAELTPASRPEGVSAPAEAAPAAPQPPKPVEDSALPAPAQQVTPAPSGFRRTRQSHWARISGMIARGYLSVGEPLRAKNGVEAKVHADGTIVVDGLICTSLNQAYEAAAKPTASTQTQNAWKWFYANRDGAWRLLSQLRDEYEAAHPEDQGRYR